MARSTSNRRAQQQDNGTHFEEPSNAQAVETANARVQLVGPYKQVQVAASQTSAQLSAILSGADGQPGIVAHSPGKILGLTYSLTAAFTAGTLSIQPTVAPAATGTAAAAGSAAAPAAQASPRQFGSVDQTGTEPSFAKGDVLGVQITTNAGFTPNTVDLDVYLIVRWDSSPIG